MNETRQRGPERPYHAARSGLVIIALFAAPAFGQVTNQDDCSASGVDVLSLGVYSWDNSGATSGTEGQNEALCYTFGTSAIDHDIWVTYVASTTGTATVDTCGSSCDTRIAAYPGTPACPVDGTAVACNDDGCGLDSSISFPVSCGDTFVVQLGSFPGGLTCAGKLTIQESGSPCGGNVVENISTAERFTTLQAAIDDPDTLNGHALRMLVPSHAEGPQVHFTKSLSLGGVVGGTTLLQVADTGSVGNARGWFLTDPGTTVSFEGLRFDGAGFLVWQAIRALGGGSLVACSFDDVRHGAYQGTGIVTIDSNWQIRDCSFSDIGRIGVFAFGPGVTQCEVDNLSYVGKSFGDHLDYALEVGGGARAQVRGATITDCRGVASTDGSRSGAVLVSTFFGSGSELAIEQSTLIENTFAIAVGVDPLDTSVVDATFNLIEDNDYGIVNQSFQNSVDATWNWWGDPSGPADASGMIEAGSPPCSPPDIDPQVDVVNVDGIGDSVDPNVAYCPWRKTPAGLGLGLNYCTNTPNSTGQSARILATGQALVSANSFHLVATELPPNQFGFFLGSNGPGFLNLPAAGLSDGFFCLAVGSNLGRFDGQVVNAGPLGFFTIRVDLTNVPIAGAPGSRMMLPGDTWYFQGWYRDAPPSSRNNFTNAVRVEFR